MRTITFNKDKNKDTSRRADKPVVEIVRVLFNTSDTEWYSRLSGAILTLKAICYDNNNVLQEIVEQLSLGSYVTLNQTQPTLEINTNVDFKSNPSSTSNKKSTHWDTIIEVDKFPLKEGETVNVVVIEKKYIEERVQDWKTRISNLYGQINIWLEERQGYNTQIGNPTQIQEELMQLFQVPAQRIDTLDVYHNGKIILSFKPKGLWTIAANGRIDILSIKGSFMLVDFAEHFHESQWYIYTADKKVKRAFDKAIFFEVLSYIEAK